MVTLLKKYLRKVFKITKRRIRNFFVAVILMMLMVYVYIFINFKPPNMKFKSPGDGYSIKTIGCSIPSLNPFDPSVIPYIFKHPPGKCGNGIPPLVYSDLDTLYVNIPVLPKYNVTDLKKFHCCYQEILKKELPPGMYRELSNYTCIVSQKCIQFTTTAKIEKEYVRVICKNNDKEIYKDFHAFVPFKKSRTKRPSVLVIGIDSTSRVNLHRQMPKTAAYLRELNAVEFFGYNKIGLNTYPNIAPALTGKFPDELHDGKCLPFKKWYKTPVKFDSCKFIWDNYRQAGFLTALAEDASWMGLFNNGYRYGFQKQPTDYYWNLFDYVMETEIGYSPFNNSECLMCAGSKFIYHTLLEYMNKFIRTLMTESYFGWFWQCSLSHRDLNLASLSDEDYEMLFIELNRTNILNNTFIIFLSDHGSRGTRLLLTHQGYLEGRLPFLYVLVPPWFEQLYPRAAQNLKINAKRLVTTFDIHETLKDLVHIEDLTIDLLQKRTDALEDVRAVSLFLPISEKRTCTSAEISIHWCSCFQSVPVEITDVVVENIAFYIVNYINLLLDNYKNCTRLALNSIISARLLISEEFRNSVLILKSKLRIYNYIVTVQTTPGGAIFESTVRCLNCDENEGNFEMQGQITRLNKYGKDGNCIFDPTLRMYCYCEKNY